MNFNEKLTDVIRTISTSIRADENTPKNESVGVFLDIDYSDCTVNDVLQFACADRRIAWANGGSGRKSIERITVGQHIKVKAVSPGRVYVDPKEHMRVYLATLSPEDRLAYVQKELLGM